MRMGAEGSRGVHQVSRQPPTHGRRSRGSDNGGGLSEPGQPIAGGQAAEAIGYGGVYSGDWAYGKRHGVGTYTYPSGDMYKGAWHAGLKHGAGSYASKTPNEVYPTPRQREDGHGSQLASARFTKGGDGPQTQGEGEEGGRAKTTSYLYSDFPPFSFAAEEGWRRRRRQQRNKQCGSRQP